MKARDTMRIWPTVGAIAVVLLIAPTLQAEEQTRAPGKRPLRVVRHVVTTGVVNREPIDAATVFSPSVGTLYYFTEVQGAAAPTQIRHVWYYQDQKLIAIPLPVDAAHWRTWSRKEILGIWTGPWKVEAVTPDGRVLSSQTFAIH